MFASLALTRWIAIITAATAAVTSYTEFSGQAAKLQRYSNVIHALQDVRLWWDKLSTTERAAAYYVEQLVEVPEQSRQTRTGASRKGFSVASFRWLAAACPSHRLPDPADGAAGKLAKGALG